MKMYEYIAASYKHFLVYNRNILLPESGVKTPYRLYVPSVFDIAEFRVTPVGFNFKGGSLDFVRPEIVEVPHLNTNFWRVSFVGNGNMELEFLDVYQNVLRCIAFEIKFTPVQTGSYKVKMSMFTNERGKTEYAYTLNTDASRFRSLPYLQELVIANRKTSLYYGLSLTDYTVVYKKHAMEGSCKVLFLGAIACLLRDDLVIDAIVLLDGAVNRSSKKDNEDFGGFAVNGNCLIARKIIWTQNPYIAKFMFAYGNL